MAALRSLILAAALVGSTAAKRPPPAAPVPPAAAVAPTIKAGVEKWRAGDYSGAVSIWGPFAQAGDADALFNMGQAYKLGRGVPADAATARDFYRKAAVKGHLPAQANLGIALFQSGDKPEAIKWLRTAADRGEARAQYVLGIAAYNGDGVPRSQSLGYGYLLRAQASGLPQAVTALGSIAPALSPTDRTAGEAVAASLAAGTGVPAALAATTAPRLIPSAPPLRAVASLPVVTPPATVATGFAPSPSPLASLSTTAAPGSPGGVPSSRTAFSAAAVPQPIARPTAALPARPVTFVATEIARQSAGAVPAGKTPPPAAPPADKPVLPPVSRPAPATPLREPTPAQADAAAGAPPRPAVATVDIPASRPVDLAKPDAVPLRSAKVADPLPPAARPAPRPAALKPFEVADASVKKPDGWRVQLGAFSARKLADTAWNDVKDAAAPAKPIFATDGPVTKLQMGPFASRDAAKAACAKLTTAGRACFVTQG